MDSTVTIIISVVSSLVISVFGIPAGIKFFIKKWFVDVNSAVSEIKDIKIKIAEHDKALNTMKEDIENHDEILKLQAKEMTEGYGKIVERLGEIEVKLLNRIDDKYNAIVKDFVSQASCDRTVKRIDRLEQTFDKFKKE